MSKIIGFFKSRTFIASIPFLVGIALVPITWLPLVLMADFVGGLILMFVASTILKVPEAEVIEAEAKNIRPKDAPTKALAFHIIAPIVGSLLHFTLAVVSGAEWDDMSFETMTFRGTMLSLGIMWSSLAFHRLVPLKNNAGRVLLARALGGPQGPAMRYSLTIGTVFLIALTASCGFWEPIFAFLPMVLAAMNVSALTTESIQILNHTEGVVEYDKDEKIRAVVFLNPDEKYFTAFVIKEDSVEASKLKAAMVLQKLDWDGPLSSSTVFDESTGKGSP